MSPGWEKREIAPLQDGPLYMDAALTPNRSLSRRAFGLLMLAVVGVNSVMAVLFWLQGAYFVAGFSALDVALLYGAFRLSYRDGREREQVQVGFGCLHVMHQSPRGRRTHYVVNPLWARVEAEESGVSIAAGGQALRIACFLSPDEREAFAAALTRALIQANRRPVAAGD